MKIFYKDGTSKFLRTVNLDNTNGTTNVIEALISKKSDDKEGDIGKDQKDSKKIV